MIMKLILIKIKFQVSNLNCFLYNFSPEDLDILVEGQCLIIKGEREVKRGSNVSKRVFNQKFDLPAGAEVDKITSEYKLDGKLIVSVPAAASQQAAGKTISYRASEILKIKGQIFVEGHRKVANLPLSCVKL